MGLGVSLLLLPYDSISYAAYILKISLLRFVGRCCVIYKYFHINDNNVAINKTHESKQKQNPETHSKGKEIRKHVNRAVTVAVLVGAGLSTMGLPRESIRLRKEHEAAAAISELIGREEGGKGPYNALTLYEKHKDNPYSGSWFSNAAAWMAVSNPKTALQWDKTVDLLRLPNGRKILNEAADKAESWDNGVLLPRYWLFNQLPTRRIETEILEDPAKTITLLSEGSQEQSAALYKVLNESRSANVGALLKVYMDGLNTDDMYVQRGAAVLLVNNPDMSYESARSTVTDNNKFLKALVELKFDPPLIGVTSLDKVLQKAVINKISKLNIKHDQPDYIRFASVNNDSAKELYTLITYSNEQAFTTTYNGLFDRLMDRLKHDNESTQTLLDNVNYDRWRTFIKLSLMYRRLNDLLYSDNSSFRLGILDRFVRNIDKTDDALSQGVAVAGIFATVHDQSLLVPLQKTLKSEYARVEKGNNSQAKIVYGLLNKMFVNNAAINEQILDTNANYIVPSMQETPTNKLFNSDNLDVQEHFFYPGNDGRISLASFLSEYRRRGWKIKDKGDYTLVESTENKRKVEMFITKPDNFEKSVAAIKKALAQRDIDSVQVAWHHGHSYFLNKTIENLPKSANVVYIGSCGDHNNIIKILKKDPNAAIISTKGTGDMWVNNYFSEKLNKDLLTQGYVNWADLWAEAKKDIGRNPNLKYYVLPQEDLGAEFLREYLKKTGDRSASLFFVP